MGRGSFAYSVVLLLIGAAIGLFSQYIWHRYTKPAPPTELKRFIPPVGTVGTSPLTVLGTHDGDCSVRGLVKDPERPEAVLCIVDKGKFVHDPCFRSTVRLGGFLAVDYLCFSQPWQAKLGKEKTTHATAIRLHGGKRIKAIPHPRGRQFRAWALELANGTRCLSRFLTRLDEPEDLKYICWREDPESEEEPVIGWVVDFPSDAEQAWNVPYVEVGHTEEGSKAVRVRRAWW